MTLPKLTSHIQRNLNNINKLSIAQVKSIVVIMKIHKCENSSFSVYFSRSFHPSIESKGTNNKRKLDLKINQIFLKLIAITLARRIKYQI